MKFTYAYKTSDGARHEAAMDAESREAVFAALREKGIKAIKVVAADGSRANGEVRGIAATGMSRPLWAAVIIGAAILAGIAVYFFNSSIFRDDNFGQTAFVTSQTRRQVIGDMAIIEKGIRTGWADVFEDEGERFLASFAIPGVKAGQRTTTEGELRKAIDPEKAARRRFPEGRGSGIGDQGLEARQIVAMVEGMKDELRAYLAAGGTAVGYGQRLVERQEAELAIYERTKAELKSARDTMTEDEFLVLWEKRNAELRNLGIRLVPLE